MNELRVAADLRAMDKVRAFMKKVLRGVEMTEEDGFKIELSLHEICINIALYAYPGEKGEIVLRAWLEGDRACFEFRDTGIAFTRGPSSLRTSSKNSGRGTGEGSGSTCSGP